MRSKVADNDELNRCSYDYGASPFKYANKSANSWSDIDFSSSCGINESRLAVRLAIFEREIVSSTPCAWRIITLDVDSDAINPETVRPSFVSQV